MPADLTKLRFYADENILGVGKALARVREDVVHPGHPLIPEVPTGTDDVDWMPVVAGRGLVVLGRDRHIRTKEVELAIFHKHGLRVFWLAGKKDLTSWAKLTRFVARWDEMERIIQARGPGPWFMAINERDIVEIGLSHRRRVRVRQRTPQPRASRY